MNPVFSKRIGCLHAGVVVVVFTIAFGVAAVARTWDPTAAGKLAGRLAFVVGPLGFLASYLYQRGLKLLAGALVGALWAALPIFLLTTTHHAVVSDAEREDLKVLPDRIHHPDFGFSLPNPGGTLRLVPLPPAMSAEFAPLGRETVAWMLRNEDASQVAVVLVFKSATVIDEQSFRAFAEGMRRQIRSVKGGKLLEDTVQWTPRCPRVSPRGPRRDRYLWEVQVSRGSLCASWCRMRADLGMGASGARLGPGGSLV